MLHVKEAERTSCDEWGQKARKEAQTAATEKINEKGEGYCTVGVRGPWRDLALMYDLILSSKPTISTLN